MTGFDYVVGFAFSLDETRLMLIQKIKPKWQKGKLNGVGGKIEPGELPIEAMVREFKEEARIETIQDDWTRFCSLEDYKGYSVYFYVSHLKRLNAMSYTTPLGLHSEITQEVIHIMRPEWCYPNNVTIVPNLAWLVPMALHMPLCTKLSDFRVKEVRKM